jgi:hypothetical protein
MKTTSFVLAFLFAGAAFAHGSKSEQASQAIASATQLFNTQYDRSVTQKFAAVRAVHTGHEEFTVTFELKDGSAVNYQCLENEEREDEGVITWDCTLK